MVKYKLTYFNIRGRAEVIRLILRVGGQEFDDHRIEGSQWADLKPKMLFGHLPVLTVDDGKLVLSETGAIVRYLAKQINLSGKDSHQEAQVDMIFETLVECRAKFVAAKNEKDPDKKEAALSTFHLEFIPSYFGKLEDLMRNISGEFFVGAKVTYADIYFYDILFSMQQLLPQLLEGHPQLKALYQRVAELPEVKAWVEARPQSDK